MRKIAKPGVQERIERLQSPQLQTAHIRGEKRCCNLQVCLYRRHNPPQKVSHEDEKKKSPMPTVFSIFFLLFVSFIFFWTKMLSIFFLPFSTHVWRPSSTRHTLPYPIYKPSTTDYWRLWFIDARLLCCTRQLFSFLNFFSIDSRWKWSVTNFTLTLYSSELMIPSAPLLCAVFMHLQFS